MRRRQLTGVFEAMTQFDALRAAAIRAASGLRDRPEPARYLAELEQNTLMLQRRLLDDSWRPAPMRTFRIRDPKPRTIAVAPFADRVVHHALCAALDPMFERFADPDSYACRVGKGQHRAILRVQALARRDPWYGRLDIRHFFETVSHDVLLGQLGRRVADDAALEVARRLLAGGVGPVGIGLPIGNLTSQHFGNFVLGHLDHFARRCGVAGWVRYMDDIVVFGHSKEDVWQHIVALDGHVRTALQLSLKDEATLVAPVAVGIPYLGVRVWPGWTRLDGVRVRRVGRRLRGLARAVADGDIDARDGAARSLAVVSWSEHAMTRGWRRQVVARRNLPK